MAGDHVVVDASLGTKWVLTEAFSREALDLLQRWRRDDVERLSPSLFAVEIGSALLGGVRRGDLAATDVLLLHTEVLQAVTIVEDDLNLVSRAIEIAQLLGLWKPYDSLYAALAEGEGCELWTGDERFWNAAKARFDWVRWVGQHVI